MEQRFLNNIEVEGTLQMKQAGVDAQYFSSVLLELVYNNLLVQKVLISTTSTSTLDWIGDTCGVDRLSEVVSCMHSGMHVFGGWD